MNRFRRLVIMGDPVQEVAELDTDLAQRGGGAQVWRLAGSRATAAVGIALPDDKVDSDWCEVVVDQWVEDHRFVLEPHLV